MFYSKYSNFTPDQIIDKKYKEICEQLLTTVKDKKIKEEIKRYFV